MTFSNDNSEVSLDIESKELWPLNEKLYEITEQTPWSQKIKSRKLLCFGHICRLSDETPEQVALNQALRPHGKPKQAYLSTVQNQLNKHNLNINEAIKLAQNR